MDDKEIRSPKGVGESTTRHGEEIQDKDGKEAGRFDKGTKGASQRPVEGSTDRDSTSVDPDDTDKSSGPGGVIGR